MDKKQDDAWMTITAEGALEVDWERAKALVDQYDAGHREDIHLYAKVAWESREHGRKESGGKENDCALTSSMFSVFLFHRLFSLPVLTAPSLPSEDRRSLRRKLLRSEVMEYFDGEDENDLVEIADGLADIVYVALGTALEYGIPLDIIFQAVQDSNMAKVGPDGKPIYRADGKVLKPEGWKPPDIEGILREHGWTGGKKSE